MPICQFVACDKDIPEHRRFCSQRCANLHRWKRTSFEPWSKMEICTVCGKEFKTTRNYRRGFKTCSKKCEGEAKRQDKLGKPLSEEHKRKVSIAHTGKKLSREHRRKIGLGVRGPRNRQWIDGRSYEKKGDADYNFEFTRVLKEEVEGIQVWLQKTREIHTFTC